MSLISEALRKARQQAAEDGNQRRGILYSWSPGARPRGTRLGLGLVLGAIIALGAALAGAGAVWWVVGHRGPSEAGAQGLSTDQATPGVSSVDASTAAPLATLQDTATVAPSPQPGADERESPTRSNDLTAEPPSDASPATLSAHPQSPPSIDPGSTARQTARPGPDQAHTATIGPDGERIYLVEADLGRVTLTLDFIVFRPDDPFAEINGLEVHVGSRIEGYTVDAIERNQVLLRDQQGLLILRAP